MNILDLTDTIQISFLGNFMEYFLFWVSVAGLNFELPTKDNQLATLVFLLFSP
jgi:hypothetical protein